MSKFNVGDRVFHVGYGVGKVKSIRKDSEYPVVFESKSTFFNVSFTADGRLLESHDLPQLLTVEEARAKGYHVPVKKWRWVVTLPDRLFLSDDYHTEERIGIVFPTATDLDKVLSTEIEK